MKTGWVVLLNKDEREVTSRSPVTYDDSDPAAIAVPAAVWVKFRETANAVTVRIIAADGSTYDRPID